MLATRLATPNTMAVVVYLALHAARGSCEVLLDPWKLRNTFLSWFTNKVVCDIVYRDCIGTVASLSTPPVRTGMSQLLLLKRHAYTVFDVNLLHRP